MTAKSNKFHNFILNTKTNFWPGIYKKKHFGEVSRMSNKIIYQRQNLVPTDANYE